MGSPSRKDEVQQRETLAFRVGDTLARHPWPFRALLLAAFSLIALYTVAILPLRIHLILSMLIVATALVVIRQGPHLRLLLVGLSLAVSFRYIWWRGHETLNWFGNPAEVALSLALFLAEFYAIVAMTVGYFQTSVSRPRKSVPLWRHGGETPSVDVFIPTYNEDVDIVRRTLVGAMEMDYPNKTVYVLDDGRREEMRALAEEVGCVYMTRSDNRGAKAGNLNLALSKTHGDLVAIFDADHVPTRSFLQLTVGSFLENPRLALVQTPHHFYNPDPFERNLYLHRSVPNEGTLFYHRIMRGLDFWNSSFFCGSCAVLKREALADVGGVAVETVTEDAHTALKMHAKGWDSAYLDIPQAAGLAAERYSAYVSQRIRWSRGMVQILVRDFSLFKRGLTLGQRINYFAASFYFLFGLPRIVFVLAPAAFLVFGLHPLVCNVWEVLIYVAPHLLLSWMNGAATHRNTRHSFWPEVFEVAIAPYTALVTTLALISPEYGKFNVTAKGGVQERPQFHWRPALPVLALLALCVAGFAFLPVRMAAADAATVLVVGLVWNAYNFLIVGAAAAVAFERPQRRRLTRVPCRQRALVTLYPQPDRGPRQPRVLSGTMVDLSEGGARFQVRTSEPLPDKVRLTIVSDFGLRTTVDAFPVSQDLRNGQLVVGARFQTLPIEVTHDLIRHMFSSPDTWVERPLEEDETLRAFGKVVVAPWLAVARSLGLVRVRGVVEGSDHTEPFEQRALFPCPVCHKVQQEASDRCGHCGREFAESHPARLPAPPPPRRQRLSAPLVALAPLVFVGCAFGIHYTWDDSIGPLIEKYDSVPKSYSEAESTTLTPIVIEARRLERDLHVAIDTSEELPGSWSKQLWALHDRYESLTEQHHKSMPSAPVLAAFEEVVDELRVIEKSRRLGTSPTFLGQRLDSVHERLDAIDRGIVLDTQTDHG